MRRSGTLKKHYRSLKVNGVREWGDKLEMVRMPHSGKLRIIKVLTG